MHGFDAFRFVQVYHLGPVNPSVIDVHLSLNIKNPRNSSLSQGFNVLLQLRVGSNEHPSAAYLVETESSYEVSISFLNVAIHNEDSVYVSPLGIFLLATKFPFIEIRVLNLKTTTGFSLPNSAVFVVVSY